MKKFAALNLMMVILVLLVTTACNKNDASTPTPPSPPPPPPVIPPITKTYQWNEFVMGADLSYVNAVQDGGGVYKDSSVTKDPFIIFKQHGTNTVRVRLWHNTS